MEERPSDIRKWYIDFVPWLGGAFYDLRNNHSPHHENQYSKRLKILNVAYCFIVPALIGSGLFATKHPEETKTFIKNCIESLVKYTCDSPSQESTNADNRNP